VIKFLTDEDYNNIILRGILRRLPGIDVVRVQEVGLMNVPDSVVLAWAAQENRIVLTHDVNTLLTEAYQRIVEGLPMPGVLASPQTMAVAEIISELIFLAENSADDEWQGQIVFLPL
jgi:hypothetical protein